MSIATIIPSLVLVSHVVFAVVVAAVLFKNESIIAFIRKHSILIGFLISLAAVAGSLYYSLGVGYTPCELCWWQRILIYPQVVLFLTALKLKDRSVFSYVWRLSALSALVALYQIYAQSGGHSLLDCTAIGGECMKIYVHAFGYITIPVMSLTVAAFLLLLSYIAKKHD